MLSERMSRLREQKARWPHVEIIKRVSLSVGRLILPASSKTFVYSSRIDSWRSCIISFSLLRESLVQWLSRFIVLPETGPLPRASVFAESQMSGSRQRKVCRESALGKGRPSAKPYLPRARPSAKNSSRQPGPLPRVRPSAKKGRWQKFIFADVRLSAKHGRR